MLQEFHIEPVGHHAIAQHTAGLGSGLEDGYLIAVFRQFSGTAQSAGTGPHNGHFFRPHGGLFKDLYIAIPGMLNQKSLDSADGDGPVGTFGAILRFKHGTASFLAQPRRRTQNTASPTQYVVVLDRANCPGNIFKSQFADKLCRPGVGRTRIGAGGVVAQQAAISFSDGLGQIESLAHALKSLSISHKNPSFWMVNRLIRPAFSHSATLRQADRLGFFNKIVNY